MDRIEIEEIVAGILIIFVVSIALGFFIGAALKQCSNDSPDETSK